MITGDHKDTAVAIAKELGIIEDASQAITGAQLNEISDEQFKTDIASTAGTSGVPAYSRSIRYVSSMHGRLRAVLQR